ncbi:MAG: hypothetical protein AAFR22_04425 [Chloroflexota bacterium]
MAENDMGIPTGVFILFVFSSLLMGLNALVVFRAHNIAPPFPFRRSRSVYWNAWRETRKNIYGGFLLLVPVLMLVAILLYHNVLFVNDDNLLIIGIVIALITPVIGAFAARSHSG